jgi:Fic family protein
VASGVSILSLGDSSPIPPSPAADLLRALSAGAHHIRMGFRFLQRRWHSFIAEIDEFKGAWRALGTLAPERLSALRRVTTIESIGSSTRIEGSQLSDREVERLLANLEIQSFASRDEQGVAGYAAVMETLFHAWQDIPATENHIKQLHRDLLQFSLKDDRHRGEYKKLPNNVAAFDDDGKQIAIYLSILA